MVLRKFNLSKSDVFNLILWLVTIYIFLASLPGIILVQSGLDPSWSYAISKAAEDKLIFGKDIIFTYGPLGYLTQGSAIASNFSQILLFRWSIHFLLLGIVLLRLKDLSKNITKIIFVATFTLILFLGTLYNDTIGITTDYKILFVFLIALTFDKYIIKHLRLISIFVGIATGLAILSKLTLGIYIAGSFILFILGNLFQVYKLDTINLKKGFFIHIQALLNFILVSLSVSVIFLSYPAAPAIAKKIGIDLLISGLVGFVLSKILAQTSMKESAKQLMPILFFYLFYSLFLIQTINQNDIPSLVDYVRNSWEISSGYSSSMSVVGRSKRSLELPLVILCLFIILPLLYILMKRKYTGLAIAFIFPAFLSFKHGFVRQDGHVIVFSITIILITSLCLLKIESSKINNQNIFSKNIPYFIYTTVFFACVGIAFHSLNYRSQLRQFTVPQVAQNIKHLSLLVDPNKLTAQAQKLTTSNLINLNQELKLPAIVLEKVNGKTIDVIPWEFSIIPANQLNWKPRPIIQSYSAYTEKLDELNYLSLSRSPRDYIFYHFQSIDRRHPFFDEPKTFSYVICNYRLTPKARYFQIPNIKLQMFLLEKQNASRCMEDGTGKSVSIPWNIFYELPTRNNSITRVRIEFQYSFVGKIMKMLFRIPPVSIRVNYLDGTQKDFRILQDNSANGVIISHLPRNTKEITEFFEGTLSPQVKSFSLMVSNERLFNPTINIIPLYEVFPVR